MKYLCYSESPYISTGTGLLSKNILPILLEMGHEVELVGINHFEDDHVGKSYPFPIHPCPADEAYNIQKMQDLITQGNYDALFLSSDVGQLNRLAPVLRAAKHQRNIPIAMYTCADCDLINHQTLDCLSIADYPVVYSQHSKRIAQRYFPALNVEVISPGCEPDVFHPIDPDQRRDARQKIFGIGDETFLVINVNRNQWRKDPGRTLMIFHKFRETHPNAVLYMHMKMHDIGGSIPDAAQIIGMRLVQPRAEIIFTGPQFNEQCGVPREALNLVYNAADVMTSTSTGEGWGLTTCDAMAAGCPLVVPRNTSFVEIIGENEERGYLVDSGGDIDHLSIPYGVSDNPRALVHSKSMLEKMKYVYDNSKEAQEKAQTARSWTLEHTWDQARYQWEALLSKIQQMQEACA